MRLYTVKELGKEWVCLEGSQGRLVKLPYGDMNELLCDAPERREEILAVAAGKEGELDLAAVEVLAPVPRPRQDVICLGMNYQAHKSEAEAFVFQLSGPYQRPSLRGVRPGMQRRQESGGRN